MDEDRVKNSLAVARKMMEIARRQHFTEQEIRICFMIGYLHDIGYEFASDLIEHNKIGGEILKMVSFPYFQ